MRRIILGMMILFGFIFLSFNTYSQKALKIGYVEVETIAKEWSVAKDADSKLIDLTKKYQDTLLLMQKELEEKLQNYQKQKAMMPADQQQKEEDALNALNQQALKYQQEKFGQNGELVKLRNEYLEPIRDKIKEAIQTIAKEENMSYVFDGGSAAVLYAEEKFDITFKVLDRLKRGGGE